MKFILLSFLLIITLASCILSTWDVRLKLINRTNTKIRYFENIETKNDSMSTIPYCETSELYNINPRESEVLNKQNKWEFSLRDHPEKILRVYIINEDSLTKYGACNIFEKEIFMKKYELTYEDLVNLNWMIIYDGK
jgi:hypothetical protein